MKEDFDALPLEYKLNHWSTLRNINIPNGLHDSLIKGKVGILCVGFPEEGCDLSAFQRSLVSNYTTDFSLIGEDSS